MTHPVVSGVEELAVLDQETAAPRGRRRQGRTARAAFLSAWPLLAVLAVQAGLSLRLVWVDRAFVDETLYIDAGHFVIYRWEHHHLQIHKFASWFSGAPVIYPPLAGAADSLGGLAGARILSLIFMLGATWMLWGTARTLFGRRAALFAVALYVALGNTQFLGAFATYDSMALFLLCVSVRLVIATRRRAKAFRLLVVAAMVLALANATKYATAIFDPVVVAMAVLSAPAGLTAGLRRGGMVLSVTAAAIGTLLALGGQQYIQGIQRTTLSRAHGADPASVIFGDSAQWIGIVVLLSVTAVAVAAWRGRPDLPVLTVLMLAGLLVPANQARIATTTSLQKHVDYGAWFACIAAGYLAPVLARFLARRAGGTMASRAVPVAVLGIVVAVVAVIGCQQAYALHTAW